MAAGLNQMIAMTGAYKPDIAGQLGRGMNVMAGMQDLQNAPLKRKAAEMQLADMKTKQDDAQMQKELQFAANTKVLMDRVQDPVQKQAAWQNARTTAQQLGFDVSDLPDQYDEQVQSILDFAYQNATAGQPDQREYRPDSRTSFLAGLGLQPGTPEYQAAADKYFGPKAGAGTQPPAAIQEWEAYQRMSPEERKAYSEMKRGTGGYSSTTEKQIFGAADAYLEDNAAAENYTDLASRYEANQGKLSSGAASSVKEWLKETTGNQDEFTALRKDWAQIKASEVVKNLPPGAASDADIKMALGGFISDNAEPTEVAAKLRGMAKLRKLNAEYSAFKADYLSENKNPGGLRKAWSEKAKELGVGGPTTSSAQPRQKFTTSTGIEFEVE